MKIRITLIVLLISIIGIVSCIKPPDFPPEPNITGVSLSTASTGELDDIFSIYIEWQDGDGDLGVTASDSTNGIFVYDDRFGDTLTFQIPTLPPQGSVEDISGQFKIELTTCCEPISGLACTPDAIKPETDQVIYTIQIKDRSGNWSNLFNAPALTILCE